MSDRGLREANREAAVVSALARCRDITPPSTSNRFPRFRGAGAFERCRDRRRPRLRPTRSPQRAFRNDG